MSCTHQKYKSWCCEQLIFWRPHPKKEKICFCSQSKRRRKSKLKWRRKTKEDEERRGFAIHGHRGVTPLQQRVTHSIVGLVTLILAFIQPLLAFVRPAPGKKNSLYRTESGGIFPRIELKWVNISLGSAKRGRRLPGKVWKLMAFFFIYCM